MVPIVEPPSQANVILLKIRFQAHARTSHRLYIFRIGIPPIELASDLVETKLLDFSYGSSSGIEMEPRATAWHDSIFPATLQSFSIYRVLHYHIPF